MKWGRNGKRSDEAVSGELVLADDQDREYFHGNYHAVQPSGIWVVLRFYPDVKEGAYGDRIRTTSIRKAASGLEAIQADYTESLGDDKRDDAEREDARYVALDFYTGHRVEALIRGSWKADVVVAEKTGAER